jgi:hypothetical protein
MGTLRGQYRAMRVDGNRVSAGGYVRRLKRVHNFR